MTEAETRIFAETAERGSPQTQYYEQRPTGPGYLSPNEMGAPSASTARGLEPARRTRNGVVLGSIIVILAIAVLTVFAAMRLMSRSAATGTPTVTRPEVPVPPTVPQPPQPPQPPTVSTRTANALDYPGADVTMEMTRGSEGSIRQLHTADSFDKVVSWYTEKLKPTKSVKTGATATLKGEKANAVITADEEEEGTNILLTEGLDK